MRFAFGTRRAPTSLTHVGKPSAPVADVACARSGVATIKPHAIQISELNHTRTSVLGNISCLSSVLRAEFCCAINCQPLEQMSIECRANKFTTETQRAQRMHGGLIGVRSSVPPLCPLCLCGETPHPIHSNEK